MEELKENLELDNVVIESNNINKNFKVGEEEVLVLKQISLSIRKGEFVSIMGPSGSGKSTLLYLLGGLDNPTNGSVKVLGKDLAKINDREKSKMRRNNIGFVFQFYNLVPNLTVEENILLPVLLDGQKINKFRNKVDEILDIVGLVQKRKYTPRQLSGGQQQRVAIARSLINDPEVIFADEPIGNLDSKSGKDVMELLRKINLEKGKTIVQVTHSIEAAKYGKRIIYVKDGSIVEK